MNHEDEYVKMICIVYLVSIIYLGGKMHTHHIMIIFFSPFQLRNGSWTRGLSTETSEDHGVWS